MLRSHIRIIAAALLAATSLVPAVRAERAYADSTAYAVVNVWPLMDMTSTDPNNPSATPNVIGMNPTESAEDVNGVTSQVSTPGNKGAVVTVMKTMIGSADGALVGLVYWNPATNAFKWYGVIDGGSVPGVDVNRSAPSLLGAAGDLGVTPTFQAGDVWGAVEGSFDNSTNLQPSLFVHFKGSDNFRKYQFIGSSGAVAAVNDVKVDQHTGMVYFTDEGVGAAGSINQLDPRTNTVTTWIVGGVPHYLAIDSSGMVYATVALDDVAFTPANDAIVRLDPASGTMVAWPLPTASGNFQSAPLTSFGSEIADGINLDGSGNVWFVESQTNKVGRLQPSSLPPYTATITEFTKPGVADPQQIAASGSGSNLQVFFTEGDGQSLSMVKPQSMGSAVVPQVKPAVTAPTVTLTADQVRPSRSATIPPATYSVPATDPEITRFFPMPPPAGVTPPAGSNPTDPACVADDCHPSGLTDVAMGGVLGNYLDPMMSGSSAVFRITVQTTRGQDNPGQGEGAHVTGGGWIPVAGAGGGDNKATFGFSVKGGTRLKGHLEFNNHNTGDRVHSDTINSVAITGNTATFTGTGRDKNNQPCDFRVTVQDNSRNGSLDTFQIDDDSSNPLPPCAVAGPSVLGGGNIVIHS